ncbi:MAG: LPXTG cell wall anchor domain-containing protein [Dehalococcoidia bacterium]
MGEEVKKNSTSAKVKLLPAFIGLATAVLAVILFWRKRRQSW